MKRKLITFTLGFCAFIFFGFFAPILLSSAPNNYGLFFAPKPTPTPVPYRETLSLLGSDIIRVTLDQIEEFRVSSQFSNAQHCLKEEQYARCDFSTFRNDVPSFFVQLYDTLFETTLRPEYKTKADELYFQLLSRCQTDDSACNTAFFAFVWRYSQTHDDQSLAAITKAANYESNRESNVLTDTIIGIHKLITASQITQSASYKILAQVRYSEMVKTFDASDTDNPIIAKFQGSKSVRRFDCGRYWVGAELAQETGDAALLKSAELFYSDLGRYYSSIGHVGATTMCLEGLSTLERATGKTQYSAMRKKILEYILSHYWDTPINPYFSGDYGVLMFDPTASEKNHFLNFKYLSETAWVLTHVARYSRTFLTF